MGKQNILFVGGWSFDGSDLTGLLRRLPEESDTNCLTLPDLTPSPFDPKASLAERFQSATKGQTYDIAIGWSLGAMLILEATLNETLSAKKLILIAPCAKFTNSPDYLHGVAPQMLEELRTNLIQNPKRCIRDFRRACAYPGRPLNTASTWSQEELEEGLDYLSTYDVRKDLHKLTIPTTLIHGDKDAIISQAGGSHLFQQLPCATLHSIPNQGHDLLLRESFSLNAWITETPSAVAPS